MVEIIPSINSPDFEGVMEKIKRIEPYVEWYHLDVTDGVFSKHLTWHNPADLPALPTKLKAEVHLMIENPEKSIGQWLVSPIKRVFVHLEATKNPDFIIQKCQEAGVEVGLAINPDTFWDKLEPWFDKVGFFLVLGVNPGPSGQKISPEALDKITHLRAKCPNCQIEADGGITPENIGEIALAGANLIVVGAAVFGSVDIPQAIDALKSKL